MSILPVLTFYSNNRPRVREDYEIPSWEGTETVEDHVQSYGAEGTYVPRSHGVTGVREEEEYTEEEKTDNVSMSSNLSHGWTHWVLLD